MIPYSKQTISDSDIDAVEAVLKSDYLTTGPNIEEFEKKLAEYTGAKFAISCSNGTAALHIACLALGVKAGDVGLTSPISFVASANCIEMCQARADFIDIDERYCLDPNKLEDYCKREAAPKVVIPVDLAGITAKLSDLAYLSKKYGFALIEDASHSIGTTYLSNQRWLKAGACVDTDLATLSFHPVKNITTGEGGAVLTNDAGLAAKLRALRAHGIERNESRMSKNEGGWWYEMQTLGYNYRLTDFQAALGSSQLKRIEQFKAHKTSLAERYNQALADLADIVAPPKADDVAACYHLYPILLKKGHKQRKFVYDFLKSKGILCQVHYIPIHLQPYYREKYAFKDGDFPAAENYYDKCLSIPLHSSLSYEDQAYVVENLKLALSSYK